MKYNNIETLATALESAVSELAETKKRLNIAKDELGDCKAERDDFCLKMVAAELDALNAQVKLEQVEVELDETKSQLDWLRKVQQRQLDDMLWEYAYQAWREMYAITSHSTNGELQARGAKIAIENMIAIIHQRSVNALFVADCESHIVLEVWGCGETPDYYYHWDADSMRGKFEMKLKVSC